MAIFISYNDPRLLINQAQAAANYRAQADSYALAEADRRFREQQRQFDVGIAENRYDRMARYGEIAHAENVRARERQADYDRAVQLEKMRQDDRIRHDQEYLNWYAQKQREQQDFTQAENARKRNLEVIQGVGGAIAKGAGAVWDWATGNTPAARADATQDRIDARQAQRQADTAQNRISERDFARGEKMLIEARLNAQNLYQIARNEYENMRGTPAERQAHFDHNVRPALDAWQAASRRLQNYLATDGQSEFDQQESYEINGPYRRQAPASQPAAAPQIPTVPAAHRPQPGQIKARLPNGDVVIIDKRTSSIIAKVQQ
jgi:hypothetical protein